MIDVPELTQQLQNSHTAQEMKKQLLAAHGNLNKLAEKPGTQFKEKFLSAVWFNSATFELSGT